MVWWGFAHCLLCGHPRKREAKISLVPVLPAHCPTLKEATKCREAKPPTPSKRADSHGFLSSLCSSSPPSAEQKQHLPPAWRSTLRSARPSRAREGCLPSWKQGAALTPKTTRPQHKIPGQREQLQTQQEQPRIQKTRRARKQLQTLQGFQKVLGAHGFLARFRAFLIPPSHTAVVAARSLPAREC